MHPLARLALPSVVAVLGLLGTPARAAEPTLRTSVVPQTGTTVAVTERVALQAQLQGRFLPEAARTGGDTSGFFGRASVSWRAHPIVGLTLAYGYGYGHYPLEGPGVREHVVQPGLRLGNQGGPIVVSNRLRADLRAYREAEGGYGFHVRPRNELAVTGVFKPWMQLSATAEGLVQPDYGRTDMLQVRTGLLLHGEIAVKSKAKTQSWRKPGIYWSLGSQVGLSPIAMWRARRGGSGSAGETVAGTGGTLDLVFSLGLSGVF